MGAHREILINYSKIDTSIDRLGSYLASLERIEVSIDKNDSLLSDQKGEAFTMLAERRKAVKELIAVQREQSLDLQKSLKNYRSDMEGLLRPESRGQNVRVRRDDIGKNLLEIRHSVEDVFPKINLPNQTNPYLDIWVSDGKGGGHFDPDQARIDRETRNGDKVDEFQNVYMPRIEAAVQRSIDILKKFHETNIKEYENTDDRHAYLAKKLYDKYTNAAERNRTRREKTDRAIKNFGRGAWDGIKGIGLGPWDLGKVGGAASVTGFSYLFSVEPPDWAAKKVNDFAAGFSGMDGPLDFFSAIGQDFCDTFEEEGIAYVAGSVTAEVATAVIPISKISLLTKSLRALRAVDKGVDAANAVDKLSDAARASKGVGKLKYTDIEIQKILDDIEGTGFKNHPLRVEYENKVMELKQVGEDMLKVGNSEETVARILHQMRRDLGVEYKNLTPKPLRDYIYEINTGRYKDPLGQPFDDMIKDGKSYTDIIESASRPNVNIDKLLSGFEDWLRR